MNTMRNDGYDIARDVNKSIANRDQELYDTISKYGYNQDFATFRQRVATESGYRKRVYDAVAKAGFDIDFGFDEWNNEHVLDRDLTLDRVKQAEKPIKDWVDEPISGSSVGQVGQGGQVGRDEEYKTPDKAVLDLINPNSDVVRINSQLKKLDEAERKVLGSDEYLEFNKKYWSSPFSAPLTQEVNLARQKRQDVERQFPELASIRRQREELENQLQTIESASRKDDVWYQKFGRGAWNAAKSLDMGMGQLENLVGVRGIVSKIESGKPLEDYEMDELSTLAATTFVNSEYGSDVSTWEKIGGGVVESLPFMAEMALWTAMTGGAGTLGAMATKAGSKQASKMLMKKLGEAGYKKLIESTSGKILRGLGKGALRVGGDALQSVAMANTTGGMRTAADAIERNMGTAMPVVDEEGNIHYGGHEGGVGLGEAIFKAEASQSIEYLSEMAGEHFDTLGKLVGKGFNKLPANRLTNSIRRGVRKASNSGAVRYARELADAVHFNSPVGETAEEYVGGLMNALIVGDQTLDSDPETGLFTREMFNQTVGVTGVTSLLFLGVGGARYGGVRAKAHHQLKASDKAGKQMFGEDWDGIKKSIEGRSLEELNDYYNYVEANAENKEQSDVIQRYVRAYLADLGTKVGGALGIKEEVNEQLSGVRAEMQVRLSESDKNGERLFGEAWADVKADIEGKSLKELEDLYDHAEDYTQVEGGADAIREYILAYKTAEANNVSAKREVPVSEGVPLSDESDGSDRSDGSDVVASEATGVGTGEDNGLDAIEAASMDPAIVGEVAFNTEGYRAGVRSEVVGELGGEEAVHNGAVTTVGIKGLSGDFTLVGGDFKVTTNERGGLELEGDRDGVVYYRDSDGAVKPTLLGDIGEVKSSVDVETEVSARIDAAREAYRVAKQQEINGVDTKSDPSREVTDRGDQVTDPARVVGGRDYKGDEKSGGEQVNEGSFDNVGQGVTEEVANEQAMLGALEEMEGRFGVQITVHRDASSIRERSVREAIEAGDTVKGWYNTRDRSVHVYLPQANGVGDITSTYLHEVVAHYGMRELLGDEKYNGFLETLWGKLDAEERSAAMRAANMEGMSADELSRDDIILACDEYVASIAERGDFDGKDRATWRKMVDAMLEILGEFLDSLNVSERDAVSIVEDLLSMSARNLERTSDKGKSRTNERVGSDVASDSRVKVREDGSKDYVGAGVEATIDDLFMETGHDTDVVDSAVQAGISEAEAKVKEAEADFEKRKKKVKGVQGVIALANERKATMGRLEGEVKFWQEVWDRLHPKEEDRGITEGANTEINLGEGNPIYDRWAAAKKVEGKEDYMILPNGERIEGRFVMVEADAMTPSHSSETMQPSEGFPMTSDGRSVNDNDYSDKRAIVTLMAQKYDKRALDHPVVVSDGFVISGNNRTMSGQMSARMGHDGEYLSYLRENASKWGFSPEAMDGFSHARVVFVPNERIEPTTKNMAKFNRTDVKQKSPSAKIKELVAIGDERLSRVVADATEGMERIGELYDGKHGEQVTKIFDYLVEYGFISQAELPQFFNRADAYVEGSGKELLEGIALAPFVDGLRVSELFSSGMTSVRNKIIGVLPQLLQSLEYQRKGKLLGVDFGFDIQQEMNRVARHSFQYQLNYDKDFKSVFVAQSPMFNDMLPEAISYASGSITLMLMDSSISEARESLNALNKAMARDVSFAERGGTDMFGEGSATAYGVFEDMERNYMERAGDDPKEQHERATIYNYIRRSDKLYRDAVERLGGNASNAAQSDGVANEGIRKDVQFRRSINEANSKQKQAGGVKVELDDDVLFRLTKRGKSSVDSWLKKREDLTNEEREAFMQYIEPMDNNLAMATGWWYAKGVIRVPEDQSKVDEAVEVARRAKVDPMRYGSPMEVLDTFKEYKIKGEAIDPESVPQLSNGRNVGDVSYGIRVYDVEDSKAGQQAMREIINTHWGEDANPWCLLQGDGNGNLSSDAWQYWNHYNGVSKRVAFKDGKLFAFCANDNNSDCWWDRQDDPHNGIPVDMKMPNDELGREATYDMNEDGTFDNPTNIHKGNKQNGVYEEWFDEKQLRRRINYKNGKRNGLREVWHFNGQLKVRENYKDGKLDGLQEEWNPDGELKSRDNYKNGELDGLCETWDINGKIRTRENYKDGVFDGLFERWYPNGALRSRENYKNNTKAGVSEEWYENGVLKLRENFRDGFKSGLTEEWYENGQLRVRSNWKNNFLDGLYEEWDQSGNLIIRSIYKGHEYVKDLTDDVRFRRNREELEGIKKRAEAEGKFMKAPNGEDTKLSEDQWLEVRSRTFKDWFGDWELPHQEVKVVEASSEHGFGNIKEARIWAKENIARVYSDEETRGKGEIRISRSAIDKFLNESSISKSSSLDAHLSTVKVLPTVISNSIIGEKHSDYTKDSDGLRSEQSAINSDVTILRLFGAININGDIYRVKTTLKKDTRESGLPSKAYSYETTKIELIAGNLGKPIENSKDDASNTINSIPATKLLKDVEKSYEKGKYLLDDYSKVVDENGEPMVVYHGTPNKDFFKFDIDSPSLNGRGEGKGFYFIADYDIAKKYAGKYGRVIPAFLNVRRFWSGFDSLSPEEKKTYLSELNDEKAYNKLGIDAFHVGGQLIVRRPNQIKSATDNVGSFSGDSDDIRFRRGKVTEEMDTEYMDAVKRGDMEAAQRLVNEAAKLNGYDVSSEYQGTSAFNGSAPYGNDYFSTKEERKAAFENDEFEGDTTLGDYIDSGIDPMNLDLLLNQRSYQHADAYRKEAISNIKDVIRRKSKTIKMYRSVPNDVQEGSFRNGDWITPSKGYAENNADIHGWGDNYRIIEQEVPIDEVWFDGNDIAEFGYGREQDYNEDTDFAYKNTRNNRKLLSPIVYNDNGEVIPLSQRFNEEVDDVRFRRGRDIEAVNERFNEELEEQIAGKQKAGHVYQLGMPSDVLRSAGVPDLPIELFAERLKAKSEQANHPFELSEVTDLPKSVQDPLAVFRSATRVGSFVVLTELKHGDKSYVVAIEANKKVGRLQVNSIRSVHYRSSEMHIVNWINDGLAEYISPVFTSNWFNPMKKELVSKRQYNSADVRDKLLSATKVVKDFENPKLEGSESSDVRFRETGDELKKREGEGLGEYAERMQRYHEANGRVGEASRVGEKPIYKGGSIGEYAQKVTAYNDDPQVVLRGVGSVSIPKAPEVTSKMSIADVAKEMNDYHHRVREVNKRLEEDMRKCRSVSGRFKYNFVDRAAALETFNESMRASGIEVPPELDAYSDMMRSAGMSNIQLDKARFDVLNPLEEELSKHSKEINDSDTFKGLRLEFRDKETGELLEGGDEAVSAFRIEGLYLQALDIIEAEELGLVGRGRSGFSDGVVLDGKSVTPEEFVELYEGVVGSEMATELQAKVKNSTDYILDICRAGGLIGEEAYQEYRSGRMHYVPQRSWEKRGVSGLSVSDVLDRVASGSVFNPAVIEARGRESLASNPLPFIANILQSSIFGMRANATKQKMLEWVERNYKELSDMGVVGLRRVYYVAKTDPISGELVRNDAGEVVYEMTTSAPSSEMLEKDAATRKSIKEVKKEISDLKKELKSGKIEEEAYDEQIDELESRLKELEDSIVVKFRGGDAPIEDVLTGGEKARNTVKVLRDGVEYQLQFNSRYGGDLVADVLNRNWATKAIGDHWVTRGMGKVTRKMSSLMTQYKPSFASANLIRDFGFASISNLADYGVGYQARFMKNMARVSGTVARYVATDEAKRTAIDGEDGVLRGYLREYFNLGAQTGWSYLPSVEELGKEMKRAVDPTTMQRVGDKVTWTSDKVKAGLSWLTEVSELTTRFAAYVTARETMNEDGQPRWSKEECAMMSKELTTNFDRRGAMSGVLGSMYGFFNASVQGTNAVYRLAKRNKAKVAGAISVMTILGFIQALLQPDDDDDDATLLPFSEWDMMTSLCIGDYKIPLPHGFRGFWGFGTQLGLYVRGEKSLTDAVYNGLEFLANALTPEQVSNALEALCSYNEMTGELGPDAIKLTRLLPTATLPPIEVWTNRDFRGMPISRKPYSTRDEASDMAPDVAMSKGQTSEFMTAIARGLFELAGGDPDSGTRMKRDGSGMVPWWLDLNPSKLEHVWDGYTGVGRVVLDAMDAAVRWKDGEKTPISWRDTQFAKPFIKRKVKDFKLSEREMLDVSRQNGYLKELLRKAKDPQLLEEMQAPLGWGMGLEQAYDWAMDNGTYAQKVYLQKLMSDSVLKGYEDGNLSGDDALRIGKELSRNYRVKVMK